MRLKILFSVLLLLFTINQVSAQNTNTANKPITENEIISMEKTWGDAIVSIGKSFSEQKNYKELAAKVVDDLYGYDEGTVLFKPTKASHQQFRLTEEEAVSYFVTGSVPEDHGFAIQPWTKVRFENAGFIIDDNTALVMGNYYFSDAKAGNEVKAEFTFGYIRDTKGNLLINLHHSSLPYSPIH